MAAFKQRNSSTLIYVSTILAILFLLPFSYAHAYTVEKGQRIYDDANLLTAGDQRHLSERIAGIEKSNNFQLYILTTSDDFGYSSDAYIDSFFLEGHKYASIISSNSVIVLINMDEREVYISSYGRCKQYLKPDRLQSITDTMGPLLSREEYSNACDVAIGNITNYMNTDYFYFQIWFQILVACGVSGIIILILAASRGGRCTVNANTYLDQSNSKLKRHHDRYIRTVVTKTKIQTNNTTGGGGNSGRGSSGHSHHGAGTRF